LILDSSDFINKSREDYPPVLVKNDESNLSIGFTGKAYKESEFISDIEL